MTYTTMLRLDIKTLARLLLCDILTNTLPPNALANIFHYSRYLFLQKYSLMKSVRC